MFQKGISTSLAVLAALLVGLAPGSADALAEDLVLFPIEADVPITFDLTDPEVFVRLDLGVHYTFTPTFVGTTFTNTPGEILPWTGSMRLLGLPSGVDLPSGAELLLVFTSLRAGPTITDPRLPAGFLFSSFTGLDADPVYVSDGNPGQLTDAEGDVFLALRFPVIPDLEFIFGYRLQLTASVPSPIPPFFHFNRGFVLVPEPGSLALLLIGMAAIAGLSRWTRGAAQRS